MKMPNVNTNVCNSINHNSKLMEQGTVLIKCCLNNPDLLAWPVLGG